MNDKVRVGVIGTGFGAAVQIPGFQQTLGAEVVAVASARIERAREVAAKFGVPHAFADYRELINLDLDLVSVVTPPYLHREMTLAALRAGKHVLCEKPMALNLDEALEMYRAANEAGLVHAIDHEFRYIPARTVAEELLRSGQVGEVRAAAIIWSSASRSDPTRPWDWWSQAERGGGVLGAIGSHFVDAVRRWLGEIVEVAAYLGTFVRERPVPGGAALLPVTSDDTVTMLLRLESGAQVTVLLTAVAGRTGTRAEFFGTQGSLVLEDDERLYKASGGEPLQPVQLTEQRSSASEPRTLAAFKVLAGRLVRKIRGEEADIPTFLDGVRVQAILDAVRRSAREGRAIRIEPVE